MKVSVWGWVAVLSRCLGKAERVENKAAHLLVTRNRERKEPRTKHILQSHAPVPLLFLARLPAWSKIVPRP